MNHSLSRREFLATSAAAGVGLLMPDQRASAAPFNTTLKKALIGAPTEETFAEWRAAGFEGMETNVWDVTPAAATEARRLADRFEMRIHSVLRGWANFNQDADTVARDIASVERALRAAQAYGADAILLVPCRIDNVRMPAAHEFDIEFDEKTGHVIRVIEGDNEPYQPYIEAHNHAADASREAVEKLIPVAEETRVVIGLENVWNNLWVQPAIFANFIASFDSPWVQCYYDIGNHVKYAMPEDWIRALGKLIVKIHVKDFAIDRDHLRGGRFVDIRDGDVNWPLVRRELDRIGYNDWMTIEGSQDLPLNEQNRRLDLIIAGE